MSNNKPRLLFFQGSYPEDLPEFLLIHGREHVKCLAQFFDVIVIDKDCDYRHVCDIHQPDLAVFEIGVNLLKCRKPRITKVIGCDLIPKLGLLNADAWCETRAGMVSDIHEYGISTVFSISTTAGAHMPGLEADVFYWPVFVDPDVYHDYGESKVIPVLLTGSTAAQYPWRTKVFQQLRAIYPCLSWPHPGYLDRSAKGPIIYGEKYARTINASLVVPTCGTVAREVVRKHLEIPACRSCLVTERSPGLEAAGFVDMESCVFADEHDVVDKLEFLFANGNQLMEISNAGQRLIAERHSMTQRSQILQWFMLQKTAGASKRIVQPNPFGSLTLLDGRSARGTVRAELTGLHLTLVNKGNSELSKGNYELSQQLYEKCLSYMQLLPEARLGLAICALHKGDPKRARDLTLELVQYTISEYKAAEPDPVEWAYYLISLLCLAKVQAAVEAAQEFGHLNHPELERTRMAIAVLGQRGSTTEAVPLASTTARSSFHRLPERSLTEWMDDLCMMLESCRQSHLAKHLAINWERVARRTASENRVQVGQQDLVTGSRVSDPPVRGKFFGHLQKELLWYRIRRKVKKGILGSRIMTKPKISPSDLTKGNRTVYPILISARKGEENYE